MTENDLWAILHRGNIARGGEWIETRLLSSGPRTNPWFQECSARVIEAGDLVAFDTDLIGPYGYCCDISRTWLCGDGGRPTSSARSTHGGGADRRQHGDAAAGPRFRELSSGGEPAAGVSAQPLLRALPRRRALRRISAAAHAADWTDDPADGVLEPGMVVCVESYVGRHGGHEGVKLEEQVLITETGYEKLSRYPRDAALIAGCPAGGAAAALRRRAGRRCPGSDERQALASAQSSRRPAHSRAAGSKRFASAQLRQSIAATSALPSATPMIELRCPPVSILSAKMARLSPSASRSRVSAMMPDMESWLL